MNLLNKESGTEDFESRPKIQEEGTLQLWVTNIIFYQEQLKEKD